MHTCALIAIERRPAALEAAVLFLPHRQKLPTNRNNLLQCRETEFSQRDGA
jgi:hypothetical protein